jgi:AraC-like DNA-binding protein
MSTPLLLLAIDVAAIVCAVLICARILISQPRSRSALLTAMIAFAMACGVLLGRQEFGYWIPPAFRVDLGGWAWLFDLARNLTPGLFMLLCFSVFVEERRFPRWLLILAAIQLCLDEPGRAFIPQTWRYTHLATQTVPALLQMLFASIALYWTAVEWRADLVEARRSARMAVLAVGGGLIVASGFSQVLIDQGSHANYLAHEALALADLAILAFVLLRVTGSDMGRVLDFDSARPATVLQPKVATGSDPALARLMTLLEEEHICQKEGLSLAQLAARVGLPEYRLRKLIHEELGYRNFNALLHDYRIREACRQLSNPALRRTPILTIALSVGYASINTFSRGFREIMGMTPSAWREERFAAGERNGPADHFERRTGEPR